MPTHSTNPVDKHRKHVVHIFSTFHTDLRSTSPLRSHCVCVCFLQFEQMPHMNHDKQVLQFHFHSNKNRHLMRITKIFGREGGGGVCVRVCVRECVNVCVRPCGLCW